MVGGVSVKHHGMYVPPEAIAPEESVSDTPGVRGIVVETAPATEQFVGEGIPAFFHISDPDGCDFSRPFEDTTATPSRATSR